MSGMTGQVSQQLRSVNQLVGMVWAEAVGNRPPCAYPSRSPRDISCMIVMLPVYILQQIVEVMACRDT